MKQSILLFGLVFFLLLGGCASEESTPVPTAIPTAESKVEELAPFIPVDEDPNQPTEYPGPENEEANPHPDSSYPAPDLELPVESYPEPPAPQLPAKEYPDSTIWVIHPAGLQCEDPVYPDERAATKSLADAGVMVISVDTIDLFVCQACDCPTSTHYRVLIDEQSLPVAEAVGWLAE